MLLSNERHGSFYGKAAPDSERAPGGRVVLAGDPLGRERRSWRKLVSAQANKAAVRTDGR
jgi:hypothetical protein